MVLEICIHSSIPHGRIFRVWSQITCIRITEDTDTWVPSLIPQHWITNPINFNLLNCILNQVLGWFLCMLKFENCWNLVPPSPWLEGFSSVQYSCSVMSDSLRPLQLQHTRSSCPSPTPGVHSNSCPLSWWCHPAISSSVVLPSSCPQSLPASGYFQWVNSLHEVAKVLEFQL